RDPARARRPDPRRRSRALRRRVGARHARRGRVRRGRGAAWLGHRTRGPTPGPARTRRQRPPVRGAARGDRAPRRGVPRRARTTEHRIMTDDPRLRALQALLRRTEAPTTATLATDERRSTEAAATPDDHRSTETAAATPLDPAVLAGLAPAGIRRYRRLVVQRLRHTIRD